MLLRLRLNLTKRTRRILRRILGALSLSTALFVFQACYGAEPDFGLDVLINGQVKSKATNLPIPGIKVSIDEQPQYQVTDSLGKFQIYASRSPEYRIFFTDIDSTLNGEFMPLDTVFTINESSTFLNVSLHAK